MRLTPSALNFSWIVLNAFISCLQGSHHMAQKSMSTGPLPRKSLKLTSSPLTVLTVNLRLSSTCTESADCASESVENAARRSTERPSCLIIRKPDKRGEKEKVRCGIAIRRTYD